ncbi:trypsin-like peptidase domain-containing protein [Streptomyces sp. NPDC048506]|uniref:trypsin-like peptidase domain-containing protein n=1 Tax=Streptomyces sp. NPDC048506 TaxID=3155028 RepID=UPI003438F8AF
MKPIRSTGRIRLRRKGAAGGAHRLRTKPAKRALTMAVGVALAGGAAAFAAVAGAAPAAPPPPPAPASPTPPSVTAHDIQRAKEEQRYWTPERIQQAVPVAPAPGSAAGPDGAPRSKRSLKAPTKPRDEGVATVGVFLIRTDDGTATANQFCSAGSVASPIKSLVITAAHCFKGDKPYTHVAFVPGYRAGATKAGQPGETPYGIFPMQPGQVWIDGRYRQAKPDDDVDFALLRVGPNAQGQLLEDATGRGNELTSVPAAKLARKDITVTGYPGGQKTPLQCTNDTSAFQGRFMEIQCDGFKSGVSGGPFLENFDGRRGNLVGVIGGYQTGGRYDHISYSSQFDGDVLRLYRQAVAGSPPDSDNPLGDAGTWSYATVMTSGRFHSASVRNGNSDLIVRWSDGELTLYPGDGKQGFTQGVQLVGPNSTWKHASLMTAGDFTGSGTNDLVVRWSDGELTLYKDVDETSKLRNEVRLRPGGSVWTRAHGIAAGRFDGGSTRADDLLVRWSDGHVSVYPNVDGKGLHAEQKLLPANKTWTYARDVVAGDLSGAAGGQDLLVRWADGEVSVFENAVGRKLTKEQQLQKPKSAWRSASLVTLGAFGGGDGRANDLVVRWPGGKLALNADSTAGALGTEKTLVPTPGG